jgi:hypothetical protein
MPRQTSSQLNTKLNWLKDRMTKTVDIAWERVIAHNENPSYYPLPSGSNSLERALHQLFEALPRKNQKDVIEKVNKTLKAGSAARKTIYGDLADVNFRSSASLVDQIKTKPVPENMKLTDADITEARRRLKLPAAKPQKAERAKVRQAAEATELGFDMVSLKCIRPTDIRKDEISLAGSAVDNVGGELVVQPFFVGDFKKDQSLDLGAKARLFNFKLTVGEFPKTFVAAVFLVEKDLLRNSAFVNALIKVCYITAGAAGVIALGMIAVGLLGGPVSVALIIGLVIAEFALGTIGKILDVMRDDVSCVGCDALVLDAPVAPGTIFDRDPILFRAGHYDQGKYEGTIRWVTA